MEVAHPPRVDGHRLRVHPRVALREKGVLPRRPECFDMGGRCSHPRTHPWLGGLDRCLLIVSLTSNELVSGV
jgi:hypothetical protein